MEINLSKKSWHYEIVNRYNSDYYDSSDLCSYVRGVLVALVKLLTIAALGALIVGYGVGDFFAWVITMIVNTEWIEPNFPATFIGSLIGVFGILFSAVIVTSVFYKNQVFKRAAIMITPTADSFLVHAYRGFKDKTCVRINFTS